MILNMKDMTRPTVKKKKKKRRSGMPIIIVLTILLIGILAAWGVNFLFGNSMKLKGEWERKIDLTSQVRESMTDYLNESSYAGEIDVSNYVNGIVISSRLTVSGDGEWVEKIDSDEYAYQTSQAKAALEKAVSDLLQTRISESYIETDMSIDNLVNEAVGMNLSSYLSKYGPELMPSFEELSEKYGCNATYEADREFVNLLSAMWGEREYSYLVTNETLVLDGSNETIVYHKAEEE